MKRILSILLALALAAGMMATAAFADAAVAVTDASAAAGGTAAVKVSVSGAGSVSSFLNNVTYDTSKLTLTGAKLTGALSGARDVSAVTSESQVAGVTEMYAFNSANGKIAYANGAAKSINGQVFELTFKLASGVSAGEKIPVTVDIAFDGGASSASGTGNVTVSGSGGGKDYEVDVSGASISASAVSGVGYVKKIDGGEIEGKPYVYIVVNYERADGTTWAVAGTYSVEKDTGEFDFPTITGVSDTLVSVLVIALDSKVGENWAGHNIAAPERLAA